MGFKTEALFFHGNSHKVYEIQASDKLTLSIIAEKQTDPTLNDLEQ